MAVTPSLSRRAFLRRAALTAAGLLASPPAVERLLADPYAPAAGGTSRPRAGSRVRVRGRVRSAGRGLPRVSVSDGFTVTSTDGGGWFEFPADPRAGHVHVSLPAGHRIPVAGTGTARLHLPLRAHARGAMDALFDLEPLPQPDDAHAFLLLADPQTQDAHEVSRLHAETVPAAGATVARLGTPVFGVACGDIMWDDLTLFPHYERAVARIGAPFFQVVGNHDLDAAGTDEGSTATFRRRFGPAWYSFNRGRVHYVVLDDVLWYGDGYVGYLPGDQLAWLEADLARVERGAPVVVFLHIPLASTQERRRGQDAPSHRITVANRELLYRLLEPFRAHVLSGHTHEVEHVREGGVEEHVNGAVCGAWWSGPICHDGTPNGYAVYEVADEELRWRYEAVGYGRDDQMRLHVAPGSPGRRVVVNVWNWDPAWTVTWFEDGERRGRLGSQPGLDPRAVELHAGPDLPARRRWVEPVPTDHLFGFEPAPHVETVTVEARDRWGRVFVGETRLAPV